MSSRRRLLRGGAALAAAAAVGTILSACAPDERGPGTSPPSQDPAREEDTTSPASPTRTLLAYYSRAGENYYYGGRRTLEVGNTQVLARMVADLIDCDVYRIEPADPYPVGYDAAVARNVREQDDDARPVIADPLDSLEQYGNVLLGSPIWNVRPPMIMTTFLESHSFSGQAVHPFVTYAVSGLGRTEAVYRAVLAGSRLKPGLAVRGEEVAAQLADVETWLRRAGLLPT